MKIIRPVAVTDSNLVSNIIDEAPEWSASTPTDEGHTRIYLGRLYESLENANTDQPDEGAVAEEPTWLDLGAINRLRPFDSKASPQAIRANNIDMTVTPGQVVTTVGVINATANSVTVQQVHPIDGLVFNETQSLIDNSQINNVYQYLFAPLEIRSDLIFDGMPNYSAPVRVIVNAGSGTASVGEVIIGREVELGLALYGTAPSLRDFSTLERNAFGDYEVVRRKWAKLCDYEVVCDTNAVDGIFRTMSRVRSTPILIIGDESKEATIVFGIYTNLQVVYDGPNKSTLNLEAESVPYEELNAIFEGGAVSAPTIIQPENGFTVPEGGSFISSAFLPIPATDTHESSSWQFSTSESFAPETVLWESLSDTVNLLEIAPDAGYFAQSSVYYARVMHRGATFGDSPWSPPVMWVAGPELNLGTPSITSPGDGEYLARNLPVTLSAFEVTPEDADYLRAVQWQIANDAGFTSIELDVTSETSLSEFELPDDLSNGATYYVRARWISGYNIPSAWSAGVEFIVGEPIGQNAYTTPGVFVWVCPEHVTKISLVGVGAGGIGRIKSGFVLVRHLLAPGGGGGALAYAYDVPVTPGQPYTIQVPAAGSGAASGATFGNFPYTLRAGSGGNATVANGAEVGNGDREGAGGTWSLGSGISGSGGNGGAGERGVTGTSIDNGRGGGGGAGGYGGNGGRGGNEDDAPNSGTYVHGSAGANGAASGGSTYWPKDDGNNSFLPGESVKRGTAGGGVGILGVGASGSAPTDESLGGKGGSGGGDAVVNLSGDAAISGAAGSFGGGAAHNSAPQAGALRIIWGQLPNGSYRAYPSTGVADL